MRAITEWIARLWGTLRKRRPDSDLERELHSHIEHATEANRRSGLAEPDAKRAARLDAGGISQAMDALRDQRGLPWLDALGADIGFGWRHLRKSPRTTAAAVLSLGLAIGATMAAFRLIDAVVLRPLAVSDPGSLFALTRTTLDSENRRESRWAFDYPTFRDYSQALGADADVMVVGMVASVPIRREPGGDAETVQWQFLSGNVFSSFGLTPAAGRLFTDADDRPATAQPVAVLGHRFWMRRFGGDEQVIGTALHYGSQRLEIVGVAPKAFTGTEPGSVTDLFVPASLNSQALANPNWVWFQMWVRPRGRSSAEQIRTRIQAVLHADLLERVKSFPAGTPKERIDASLNEEIKLVSAAAGVSEIQTTFRQPLFLLNALAALVLLMACVNVAATLVAQAIGRQKEIAVRVSLGATRGRLIRLLLVESALLALMASTLAVFFASWAAPVVVSMLESADRPVRLVLDFDWRALGFCVALTAIVTLVFGLIPAIRASAVRPVSALKTENAHEPRRMTSALVIGQMAFSFVVLFIAGLFVASFERLSARPLGFSAERVLLIQVESRVEHPPQIWGELIRSLRETTGIETAAMAAWAPLSGNTWTGAVRAPGIATTDPAPYFLDVSTGYFETLGMTLRQGRDFRPADRAPGLDDQKRPIAGVGIVNGAFARRYFGGSNPVGRRVSVGPRPIDIPLEIVGLVDDAVYLNVRESLRPIVYVPIGDRSGGTILVRTTGDAGAMSAALGRKIPELRADVRVRRAQTQQLLVTRQTTRDRVLATLSLFFAGVALLLAGIGLYGVVNGAVLRQRREIGIRLALGARRPQIVRRVVARVGAAALAGCLVGLIAGVLAGRVIDELLFNVRATDLPAMILPALALAGAAVLAALPPVTRAVRTNLVRALRE